MSATGPADPQGGAGIDGPAAPQGGAGIDGRPRIAPLPPSEWDEFLRGVLAAMPGGTERPMNVFTTLARAPQLFRPWIGFGGALLGRGRLSARDRELAILRTAHNCASGYEWAQHVVLAREAGVDDAEVAALRDDLDAHHWSGAERALLEAADELHASATLGDVTWGALSEVYDEAQLIELVMLVGQYHMVAFALNALRVQIEPGGAGG